MRSATILRYYPLGNLFVQEKANTPSIDAVVGTDVSLICMPDCIRTILYAIPGGAYPLFIIEWSFKPQNVANISKYVGLYKLQLYFYTI